MYLYRPIEPMLLGTVDKVMNKQKVALPLDTQ